MLKAPWKKNFFSHHMHIIHRLHSIAQLFEKNHFFFSSSFCSQERESQTVSFIQYSSESSEEEDGSIGTREQRTKGRGYYSQGYYGKTQSHGRDSDSSSESADNAAPKDCDIRNCVLTYCWSACQRSSISNAAQPSVGNASQLHA